MSCFSPSTKLLPSFVPFEFIMNLQKADSFRAITCFSITAFSLSFYLTLSAAFSNLIIKSLLLSNLMRLLKLADACF